MITGDDYIALATRLSDRKDAGEASYRSAVSRAYYGAFHLAGAFLSQLGFSIPRGSGAHGWIPQALIGSGQHDAAEAGRLLQDLHAERIVADYRWERRATGSQSDAKTSVQTALTIGTILAACAERARQKAIKSAISRYLEKRGG